MFDMKLLNKAKWAQQISKEFAYLSYLKYISMGLLIWSNYKIFVGNYVKRLLENMNSIMGISLYADSYPLMPHHSNAFLSPLCSGEIWPVLNQRFRKCCPFKKFCGLKAVISRQSECSNYALL